jgi:hypothetical protein
MKPLRPLASLPRWGGLCLALALVACGEPGDDPRVQRLNSDLALAQERITLLERRLAEASSDRAERTALRDTLASAEARIAVLETPEGMAEAATEPRRGSEVRGRLVAATRALRAADGQLAAVSGDGRTAGEAAPVDTARAARAEVATAADNIVAAASALGMEIIGLAR